MAKEKVLFCSECCERTVHRFICKETDLDGNGLARVMLAVASFGLSEALANSVAVRHYQCQCCGKLRKE